MLRYATVLQEDGNMGRQAPIRHYARLNAGKPRLGRVQRQVRRAFVAAGAQPLTIAELLPFCFPRADSYARWMRWSVLGPRPSLPSLRAALSKAGPSYCVGAEARAAEANCSPIMRRRSLKSVLRNK